MRCPREEGGIYDLYIRHPSRETTYVTPYMVVVGSRQDSPIRQGYHTVRYRTVYDLVALFAVFHPFGFRVLSCLD